MDKQWLRGTLSLVVALNVFPRSWPRCGIRHRRKKASNNLRSVLDASNRWYDFFSAICRQLAGISREPLCEPKEDGQVPCVDHDEAHVLRDITYMRKDESGNTLALAPSVPSGHGDSFKGCKVIMKHVQEIEISSCSLILLVV